MIYSWWFLNAHHQLWPLTRREYHIHAGKTEMAASLKKQFPGEEEAIDEFMRLMKVKGVDRKKMLENWMS